MQLIVLPVKLVDLGKFQDLMSRFLEFVISISFLYLYAIAILKIDLYAAYCTSS